MSIFPTMNLASGTSQSSNRSMDGVALCSDLCQRAAWSKSFSFSAEIYFQVDTSTGTTNVPGSDFGRCLPPLSTYELWEQYSFSCYAPQFFQGMHSSGQLFGAVLAARFEQPAPAAGWSGGSIAMVAARYCSNPSSSIADYSFIWLHEKTHNEHQRYISIG